MTPPEGESYRQHRKRLAEAGLVRPLALPELLNRRRSQARFNEIVETAAQARRASLKAAAEASRAAGDERRARRFEKRLRTVKREVIVSPERKNAMRLLEASHHKNDPKSLAATRRALRALGRRQGIPDWVPPGLSERFKAGKLRGPSRLPAAFRGWEAEADQYDLDALDEYDEADEGFEEDDEE